VRRTRYNPSELQGFEAACTPRSTEAGSTSTRQGQPGGRESLSLDAAGHDRANWPLGRLGSQLTRCTSPLRPHQAGTHGHPQNEGWTDGPIATPKAQG